MGQATKARARRPAGRSRLAKWLIAAAIIGAVGYGVSQMSNIAYRDAEIKVIDFSGLDATQKRSALEAANAARCTCGCGMTLAQCVATDSTCPIRAFEAATLRSAAMMSGRRRSSSDGSAKVVMDGMTGMSEGAASSAAYVPGCAPIRTSRRLSCASRMIAS